MIAVLAIVTYFVALLAIGWRAERGAERSARGYYLAGGGLGSLALLFALFGTNCSPFVLMGIPARATTTDSASSASTRRSSRWSSR